MNYINKYAFILTCFVFSTFFHLSCVQRNKVDSKKISDFPFTLKLEREIVKTAPNLYCVASVLILDSIMITMDLKADTIFQVYKLPSFKNIGGFICRGHGPKEEFFIDPYIQKLTGNQFMYMNFTEIKFIDFNVKNNTFDVMHEVKLSEEIIGLFHIFKIGKLIIGTKIDEPTNKEFVAYNTNTGNASDFGEDFPVINKHIKLTALDKNNIFAKVNTVRPDGKAFASVYDKFPILRIYSNTGKLMHDIRLENNQSFPIALLQSEPSPSNVKNIVQNYRMIRSTNEFIYALYIGKKEGDLAPGLNDFSDELHIWDWNGTPKARLKLDKKIFSFDVDKNNNYLICSSLESLDAFYKYTIKGLF